MSPSDRPAILGGSPICDVTAWPRWPQWDATERDGLIAALETGAWWAGDGAAAQSFADDFARFQGAGYALPFTNGTHTMEAALAACDVGEGDEVIVPGLTFVATASAVLAANAVPVLVDIDPDALTIDIAAVDAAITARTRAVIAVHLAGNACDLDALVALCARRDLRLIEDCAHAHGTFWRGRGAGSYGDFGSFSMQQSKLLTAGEGGVLMANDPELMERAWSYWNCGRVRGRHWYDHPGYGSNLRMTEWQGAVLAAQLARFPAQNRRRNANARALDERLVQIPGLAPQRRDPRMDSQGHFCFVFHYDDREFAGLSLRGFEAALAAEGIPLGVSYPSLSTLGMFRDGVYGARLRTSAPDLTTVSLPRSEHAARSTVWMEHRVLLADGDAVGRVADAAERIRSHAAALVRA